MKSPWVNLQDIKTIRANHEELLARELSPLVDLNIDGLIRSVKETIRFFEGAGSLSSINISLNAGLIVKIDTILLLAKLFAEVSKFGKITQQEEYVSIVTLCSTYIKKGLVNSVINAINQFNLPDMAEKSLRNFKYLTCSTLFDECTINKELPGIEDQFKDALKLLANLAKLAENEPVTKKKEKRLKKTVEQFEDLHKNLIDQNRLEDAGKVIDKMKSLFKNEKSI